jgi:chromosome segregation ATPase
MNDQLFVNTYIKILNDTLTEAINKNLVLQAQLEVTKQTAAKTAEYETKNKELEERLHNLSSVSSNNNVLQNKIDSLRSQLDQTNAQVINKNSHVETFKRELIDARNVIKAKDVEINLLKSEIVKLKSKKRKKEKALNNPVNGDIISISDTF